MSRQIGTLRVMRIIARMNVGGPALQAVTLMRGLPADQFEQRLYTGFVGPNEADYVDMRAPGLPIYRIPALGRRIGVAADARALAALTAEMRRFRPHIVHTHTAKAGTLGRAAAILARVPGRVHTFHGHLLQGYFAPPATRLVARAESLLARHTDRLIAVGAQVRDDLLAARIGRPAQYDVVAPGTRLGELPDRLTARQALGLPPDVPVVAYVGRLTRIKRPDRLIAVAREVIQAVPDARFVVCGDGDLAAEVARAATDLGRSLLLLGWRADVETVYAAADLILLTSDNEGMPVSLIEAGLAGLPAVATAVGSVAEVVEDGRTGLLAPCDAEHLARIVIGLLGDEALRRRLGVGAAARCQELFGPERLVSDVQRVYEEVAAQYGWWPERPRARHVRPVADSRPTPVGRVPR